MANNLIDDVMEYEEKIDNFSGPTTSRQAVVVKRLATKSGFLLILKGDEDEEEFNLKCPDWMYEKARPNVRVEVVYELIHGKPDEYRESLLGLKRLSPSGKRTLSWVL